MATKANAPCRYPLCPAYAAKGGYCDSHKAAADAMYHDPEAKNFYASRPWRRTRQRKLSAQPLCEECQRQGKVTAATQVDHVVPRRQDRGRQFDTSNLQSLCHSCHSRKTAKEVF